MSERFELPAELTIYSVAQTRDALLAWSQEQVAKVAALPLKVSASQVAAVDGSGLQLLAALGNMGLAWQLVETSAAFSEACDTMGLAHWLDSPYLQAAAGGASA
jgi:ABC-type transporter Mla MlaB component